MLVRVQMEGQLEPASYGSAKYLGGQDARRVRRLQAIITGACMLGNTGSLPGHRCQRIQMATQGTWVRTMAARKSLRRRISHQAARCGM